MTATVTSSRTRTSSPENAEQATTPTGAAEASVVRTLLETNQRTVRRRLAIIVGLTAVALVAFFASTVVGPINLSIRQVVLGIANPSSLDSTEFTVLWKLRLPMSVMALLVGISLSVAGAQMQTILGNPLAEPFTLGISAAAAFGGAAGIVFGIAPLSVPQLNLALLAWLAAMVATSVIILAALYKGATAETMILLGIGLVFLFQAMLALMQYRSSAEALQRIVFWTMGSLTRASWLGNAVIAGALAVALPVLWLLSWQLTALRLGDERALAMGVNVTVLRVTVLAVVSLLSATAVAFCGIIGFVGLVGPHIARMLVGEEQRFFLPASMAAGAALMCGAHALSLIVVPGVAIPIGIITALVGVPCFVAIVLSKKRVLW
ncbi:FecCD family ABC transporter permease [Corynebacterium epidermidicanis]|uniref:ABC-type Fe3+-siderophore transport system, permease component n=1 Tax=Corynebacterium epidermidicanis TaxID=1050174 RepID=A0A0G3GS32_9CORY|nr:iron ABC transporter permease [Corynebacterium epidermidicanis]AKK03929.1 ABC-type Fe3+-siderophore transport system, permease component [Corynebacterium epidermidicanis]